MPVKTLFMLAAAIGGLLLVGSEVHDQIYVHRPFDAAIARWEAAHEGRDLPAMIKARDDACEALRHRLFSGAPKHCDQ